MQVPRRDKLIVLGDFNAKAGSDSTIWGNVVVKHGVGNINCNGNRLLCLCSEFGLYVTNTLFQLKHKHKTTWMHPRSKYWHLLYYILVKAVDLQDVQMTRVMSGAECWTDHRLVRTSLRIRICLPAGKQKPQRRLNVRGLGRRADLSSLRAAISSNLAQVSDCSPLPFQSSSDVTKQADTLSKAIIDAAVDTRDGVSRLGLGLETCLETRFLESRSRSRRSQVSSRSRSRRIFVLVSSSSSRDFALVIFYEILQGVP